jgi:hypothetical protein
LKTLVIGFVRHTQGYVGSPLRFDFGFVFYDIPCFGVENAIFWVCFAFPCRTALPKGQGAVALPFGFVLFFNTKRDGCPALFGQARGHAPTDDLGSSAIAMSDFPSVNFVKWTIDESKESREIAQINRNKMSRCFVRFVWIYVSFLPALPFVCIAMSQGRVIRRR